MKYKNKKVVHLGEENIAKNRDYWLNIQLQLLGFAFRISYCRTKLHFFCEEMFPDSIKKLITVNLRKSH